MSDFEEKYDYQEIMVEDISQIYQIANDYNSFYDLPRLGRGNPGDERTYLQAFYRGQSDSSWKITPSICRDTSVDESILESGDLLFEVMAYNQHYIHATRLIDFTMDVNVALFFACCENIEKDAAIFIWSYSPYDPSISGKITIPLPSGYDGATAKIRGGATAISSTETTVTFPVTLEVAGGSTFTELYVEYKEKPQCTHSYDNDADTTCNLCGYVRTVTAPKPYITGGKNEKWTQGSSKELVFTSNAPLSEFVSVTIDGQVVDEKYYVKEEGSTIIKLKADYLSTLSAGKHTISINSTSGSATTPFTIEKTKSPDTGDNNNLFVWAAMLCLSGFAIFGTRIYSKKEKTIE